MQYATGIDAMRWRENASLPSGADELYAYDGMNQLIDAQRGVLDSGHTSLTSKAFQQHWSLDATGNWSEFQEDTDGDNTWDVSQTRAHNPANEILSMSDPQLDLAHDRAGNMTVMPNPQSLIPNPQSLVFDAWNRLVKVADGEVTIAEYEYDGLFRRVRKLGTNASSMSTTRDFYYSAQWHVLEEYLGDEGSESLLDQRFAWGIRYIDDLIFREYGEDFGGVLQWRLFAMQDANWNVIAACGWTGSVHERYRYDAYGAPIYLYPDGSLNPAGSDYFWDILFTGRHLDPDTNLYHYRFRDYHHSLGRFLTRDPIGYQADDPSLYRYCEGSPINALDPGGLDTFRIGRGIGRTFPAPRGTVVPSHEFLAQTDANGKVISTQSWGNDFNKDKTENNPTHWRRDIEGDKIAAQRAIDSKLNSLPGEPFAKKIGDSSLDPYAKEAYDLLREPGKDSPSAHDWGEDGKACKKETKRLETLAKALQNADKEPDPDKAKQLRTHAMIDAGLNPVRIEGVPPIQ